MTEKRLDISKVFADWIIPEDIPTSWKDDRPLDVLILGYPTRIIGNAVYREVFLKEYNHNIDSIMAADGSFLHGEDEFVVLVREATQ